MGWYATLLFSNPSQGPWWWWWWWWWWSSSSSSKRQWWRICSKVANDNKNTYDAVEWTCAPKHWWQLGYQYKPHQIKWNIALFIWTSQTYKYQKVLRKYQKVFLEFQHKHTCLFVFLRVWWTCTFVSYDVIKGVSLKNLTKNNKFELNGAYNGVIYLQFLLRAFKIPSLMVFVWRGKTGSVGDLMNN